jgi:HPt (histidine-containing phosphotransfer) domain-containing protein
MQTDIQYPGVDMELVDELSQTLEAGFCELIDIFLEDTPMQIDQIANSIATGDLEHIRSYAHILSGSCSNFGCDRLNSLSSQLRDICKTIGDDRPALNEILRKILLEYSVVSDTLKKIKTHYCG